MSMSKTFTSAVVAAAVAASTLVPLASAANARDFGRGGAHRGGHGGPHFVAPRHGGGHGYGYGHRRHRDHTGRAVAVGAFAAILGLALAAESNKVRRDYYDDYRD